MSIADFLKERKKPLQVDNKLAPKLSFDKDGNRSYLIDDVDVILPRFQIDAEGNIVREGGMMTPLRGLKGNRGKDGSLLTRKPLTEEEQKSKGIFYDAETDSYLPTFEKFREMRDVTSAVNNNPKVDDLLYKETIRRDPRLGSKFKPWYRQ
jgi:hypothetical protein